MTAAPPVGAEAVKVRVHRRLLADADPSEPVGAERVARLALDEAPLLPAADLRWVVDEVLAEVAGLGPLDPLLADPAVTEVMVNGPGPVWVERAGRLERLPIVVDTPTVERLIERIVAPLGRRADRSSPLVDARLPDGSRVNAVVPPVAVDGPCLTIRRFGARAVPLSEFCAPNVARLLGDAVRQRRNVVVSGGTGAGKTTLLNALAGEVPAGERLITVEDAAELRLPQDHVVRLEARPPNADGAGGFSVRELVHNALRMRPDRIVVGEVRAGEALDMLQAMNTGHEGSLSTCHANGPDDALRRLETMVLMAGSGLPLEAVRDHIHAALDLVVQVERQPQGGRRVAEVAEVLERPGLGAGTRRLATGDEVLSSPQRPPRARAREDSTGEAR